MTVAAYYPMFADLKGRRCLVVGGGAVAQRKATALLRYGAEVTVISPTLTRRLSACARQGTIRHRRRSFRPNDLAGVWLVYAATNEPAVNELVSRTAARRRIFANIVDQTPLCSFIAPAIMTRGDLTVAISTGGASPSLAKRLRRDLGRTIGAHYVSMLRLLGSLRGVAKRRLASPSGRKRYFARLLEGRVFELVRAGKLREARREAQLLLERHARNGHETQPRHQAKLPW